MADITVAPLTVDDVKVDFWMFDPGLTVDLVKVDDVIVEPSTLLSVNVVLEVTEFVHVDLVDVFPGPLQSPPYVPETSRYVMRKALLTKIATTTYHSRIKLQVVTRLYIESYLK